MTFFSPPSLLIQNLKAYQKIKNPFLDILFNISNQNFDFNNYIAFLNKQGSVYTVQYFINGMDSRYSHEGESKYVSSQSSHGKQRASRHRKMFIQKNSQEQEEIVIPYWDDESSSHYHLIEQVRLLKKKNQHFQSHMGRMKQQYEQLKLNLQQMDQNQKEHIRRFSELNQRYTIAISKIQQLKTQSEMMKHQNDDLQSDLRAKEIRQQENRKKINKLKDQQAIFTARILQLQSQIKLMLLKFEQEKRVLERSKDKQLEIFKLNFDQDSDKLNSFNLLIAELKSCVGERDQKIQFLQKQFVIISKECQRLKQQKDHKFSQKSQTDIEELIDRYNKQIAQLNNTLQQKRRKIQTLDKQNIDLKMQNEKLKNQHIKLLHQNSNVKLQIQKYEDQIKQLNKKDKKKKPNSILKTVDLIYSGLQKQKSTKASQNEQKWKQLLREKQTAIINLNQTIKSVKQKLQQQNNKNRSQIVKLEHMIQQLKQKLESKQKQFSALRSQKNVYLNQLQKYRIQLSEKTREESKPQPKQDKQQDDKTLSELEAQYNAQLQALRRLVLYKKYPQAGNNEIQHKLRFEYQNKFDILVRDYQQLQKQLLFLQEELILRQHESAKEMITFRTSEEERILYMQAIRKWQIAYEELHAIYEAKLVSKDQEINLLNLRLVNSN